MQYWINQDGVQHGPVTLSEMEGMGLTADAYVWHNGLEDWVRITEVPELAGTYAPAAVTIPPLDEELQAEEEPNFAMPPLLDEERSDGIRETPSEIVYTNEDVVMPLVDDATASPASTEPLPECPPTNLVWAIITTILCCIPAGIVAIIYAGKVNNRYLAGDYDGAFRASEAGAWWCIGGIVAGIALQPLAMLLMM